ncbi:MAG: hypothetical protein SNJ84_06180 [Verrucomicrobiia bacterium]
MKDVALALRGGADMTGPLGKETAHDFERSVNGGGMACANIYWGASGFKGNTERVNDGLGNIGDVNEIAGLLAAAVEVDIEIFFEGRAKNRHNAGVGGGGILAWAVNIEKAKGSAPETSGCAPEAGIILRHLFL